jgi:hypothetical protein
MPSFLDSRDLRFLIGAGVVMVVLLGLTFALGPAPVQQSLGYPSSYASEWAGAKAAYLLLEEQGYRVERWEKSPEDLPENPDGAVLVLAEPTQAASASELAAIRRFVSAGGRVLAIGATAAALVPDLDAAAAEQWDPQPKTYEALLPSPVTRDAPEISMVAPDTLTSSEHPWLALYGQNDEVVVISYRVGKGEIIWWASASPLTNGLMRENSNLALFLNSIGAPANQGVYWDEYFHGARASMISYFETGPLPWAGLQIAIAFLAVLFTFSRRAGAMRMPATESRLSPLEFVETLGDLYQSAHASGAAVSVAYRRFRLALSRKLSTPSTAKLPELCRAASSRFLWPEDALLDTLARSERAMRSINLDEQEALYLVRQLHDYSARLEPRGRADQENTAWR